MKKYLLIIIFIVIHQTKAFVKVNYSFRHSFVEVKNLYPDTINIIQDNIIAHKEKFQHQELNILLKELHLIVKSYIPIHGSKPGGAIRGIILSFEDPITVTNKLANKHSVPHVFISFETQISMDKALELYHISHGNWQQAEIDFYGKQLVKDVQVAKRQ